MTTPKRTLKLLVSMLAASSVVANAAGVDWRETFDTAESFAAFTVINANNDGKKWEYSAYNKWARMTYNDEMAMDDWLITPGFELTPGVYKFSLDAKNYMDAEKFEVFAGSGNSVADMTQTVIEKTTVSKRAMETFTGEFTVTEAGTWYVGIHACSDAGTLYLDVDNLSLTRGVNPGSPVAVAYLAVTADASGLAEVTVTCTLPAVDAAGNVLTALDKVEVLCDNEVVASEAGSPAAAFNWVHAEAPLGRHTYTVVAYAGGERGAEVSQEVFTGPNVPGNIPYLAVGEFNPGEVTVRWRCPETDVDGNPLNPDLVTFKVVRYEVMEGSLYYEEDIEEAENVTGTEFVHRAVAAGDPQIYTAYGVYAQTTAGRSAAAKTPLFPVGTSYEVPFKESFDGGAATTLFRSETVKYYQVTPMWDAVNDTQSDIKSRDNDFGYLAMMGEHADDCARFYSGKIDLKGVASPQLSFYVYNYFNGSNTPDLNTFEVYVNGGNGTFEFQKEFVINDLPANGWNRVTVPLDAFKDKTIQFAFSVTVKNYMSIPVDCIEIKDAVATNLAAVAVEAPEKVTAGAPFTVNVVVENLGTTEASGYKVELYRDGELIETLPGEAIAPDCRGTVAFTHIASVFGADNATFSARVVIDGDADEADNSTDELAVAIVSPTHPVPAALTGEADGDAIVLSWTAPDFNSAIPDAVTDDFESYESFATGSAGGWKFVDADGAPVGKLTDIAFPNVTIEGASASFWVMDSNLEGLNNLFEARSGSRYLAQMFNADASGCDDWAISPVLFGGEQTISFYAKGYSVYAYEQFEVLYSTTGTEIAYFKLIEKVEKVSNSWTRFEFTLPDGALYFAIRCTSVDCYMLFVDDVTYIPGSGAAVLNLAGYNVYRNNDKLNAEPVATPTFRDEAVPDGTHSYKVTALYDRGESLPSEEYVTTVSGVESVSVADVAAVKVEGLTGEIAVTSPRGTAVAVFGADGSARASFIANGNDRIALARGIYLVKVGTAAFKVAVK